MTVGQNKFTMRHDKLPPHTVEYFAVLGWWWYYHPTPHNAPEAGRQKFQSWRLGFFIINPSSYNFCLFLYRAFLKDSFHQQMQPFIKHTKC